jgi:2-succinyl-6-hydroxy-2,4-cyclohexadiene-1-carboxylate synthase
MMKFLINSVSYHVEISGEGFPFLLLHGFTGDSSTWKPFYDKWGKHSKLIIPDLIGHGKTDSPEDATRYQIENVASDLIEILDQLGIEQVDLLGYSMGGRLALAFAILYPNRLRKLILESSSPGLSSEEEREARRMKDGELAEFIRGKGIKSFVDYWECIPLFSSMKRLPLDAQKTIRKQRLANNTVGLSNSLEGMGTGAQASFWESLHLLRNEVLLVTGEIDEKFCRIAEKMIEEIKNGKWITIKNSGHANHVEEKEKFGTIVSEFLTKEGLF